MAVNLRHPVACPFARQAQPPFSPNAEDVACGIAGHVQPSEGSPCCDTATAGGKDYWRCPIRQRFIDINERMGTVAAERAMLTPDRRQELVHATRDRIRV